MRNEHTIAVVIPALDEAGSIAKVIAEIPDWVDDVVVGDNGSSDDTRAVAEAAGARTVLATRRGYGSACLAAIAALDHPDIVVFLDGDYSDYPGQMDRLVDPITRGEAELVIGSRALGKAEKGALSPQARFGNRLACFLMRAFWGVRHTDLGPFRAIRYSALRRLGMRDPDYGWTVEMQIKAAVKKIPAIEAPVDYRARIGRSKVSGTVRGVIGAGYKILSTIFVSAVCPKFAGKDQIAPAERLVIFTRFPEPGKTKTRLIPELGAESAAKLQRTLTEYTVALAERFAADRSVQIEVRYDGADRTAVSDWLGPQLSFTRQGDGDLGDRMGRAFQDAFREGLDRVVIIGTDCPQITPAILSQSFESLRMHEIVVGPAADGGYYLIGMKREAVSKAVPALFNDMPWGSSSVMKETLHRAKNSDIDLDELEILHDVDRPEDIAVWTSMQDDAMPLISVVVPAVNETECIEKTVRRALTDARVEVVVVDGGSDDDTAARAESAGATVRQSIPGRAVQMNRGAEYAQGPILLFLHADTLPPHGYGRIVRRLLAQDNVAMGAFRFKTELESRNMRIMEWGANRRSRIFRMPYGDQAYFMKKSTFERAGGFPVLPIMEDVELVRRLKKEGQVVIADSPVVTSGRRWQSVGVWKTFFVNQWVFSLYFLGVSPESLARFYRRRTAAAGRNTSLPER